MDDQHRLISGYRDLSAEEIERMNAIKVHAADCGTMIEALREIDGIDQRWISIGQTNLQQGFMALVRAVAKPETF